MLNPAFDGVNNVKVFNDNQIMSNLLNGYISLQLSLRATHLIGNKIYYNTAFSKGEIGNTGSRILVIDSSNNGNVNAIDPNADGDPGDLNENIPTPYYFGIILPVRFIDAKAVRISNGLHNFNWTLAPPANPVDKFDVEYSEDNIKWQLAGTVAGEAGKNKYYLNFQVNSKNALYYRIRAYESIGKYYLSQVILVSKLSDEQKIKITPYPANEFVRVYSPEHNFSNKRSVTIIDISGKKIFDQSFLKRYTEINTSKFPDGYYVVNVEDKAVVFSEQMLVKHR